MLNNEEKSKIFNDLKKELSETTVPESNTNAPAEKIFNLVKNCILFFCMIYLIC